MLRLTTDSQTVIGPYNQILHHHGYHHKYCQPIPAYSSLFQHIAVCFSLFQPIPANSSLFQHISA